MPAFTAPNHVLRVPGEANRIALAPERGNTRAPESLEAVAGDDKGHNAESNTVERGKRAEGFALEFFKEGVKTRSEIDSQTEEEDHAPEDHFSPELRVETEDVKTEALTDITHGVVAVVAEARIETDGGHHEHRGEILRLKAVADHKERDDADIGHLLTLTPAECAGRVAHHIAENDVGNADGKQNNQETAPADEVVEGFGFLDILVVDRTGVVRHVSISLKVKDAENGVGNVADVHENNDGPGNNEKAPGELFLFGFEKKQQHGGGKHQKF
ncbi:hypothetical protein EVA_06967 [gut metagenome]|uniref:Uncharacterized protein n=1 Tax=gut metagenome TaxID=749906 RepID=J9GWC0_9ZZZZ